MQKETATFNFSDSRNGQLNESFLTQFGEIAKIALERALGISDINVLLKGSRGEVESFYKTIQGEKTYLENYLKYGLNNPSTYKSKSYLENAIKNFERNSNLKWPFKD